MSVPAANPVSSPVCYGGEADEVYMGYLDQGALIEALTTLLEAERAGARVGARLVQMAEDPPAVALARCIRDDEARWCRMLTGALRRLGAKPSTKVGDFYGKALAIEGFEARLAFVNRGQAWVVRKLAELMPKVRDDRLHADLKAMHDAHTDNIELAEGALALRRRSTSAKRPASPR